MHARTTPTQRTACVHAAVLPGTRSLIPPPPPSTPRCLLTPTLPCPAPCRYLIERAHVAVVPGDAFGAPDCIRISYAASLQTLQEAMNRICSALDPAVYTRKSG